MGKNSYEFRVYESEDYRSISKVRRQYEGAYHRLYLKNRRKTKFVKQKGKYIYCLICCFLVT